MKFSVLLPTRNGGPYIKDCIDSIIMDLPINSELIISDNANTDQTKDILIGYIQDKRIKILHSNEILSVTDNWNNALAVASGDYILMMGDDDFLLPCFFKKMLETIDKFNYPDCILYNAYGYIAPGSMSAKSTSYYREEIFKFKESFSGERVVHSHERKRILTDMFKFTVGIPLNMQTILVKRSAFNYFGGKFLPPFPDHYAINALLLLAEKWVFIPDKPVVCGISPKSFGHYIYSNKQNDGLSYLGINTNFSGRLPGNELLNGMCVWLLLLKKNFPKFLEGISLDRKQYVRRQVYAWLLQFRFSKISCKTLFFNFKLLNSRDLFLLFFSFLDLKSWVRFFRMLNTVDHEKVKINEIVSLTDIKSIKEFGNWLLKK